MGGGHDNILADVFRHFRRHADVTCGGGGFELHGRDVCWGGFGVGGHNNVLAAVFLPWWRRR